MMSFLTMDADELEEGMYVHPPAWATAPDRYDKITNLRPMPETGMSVSHPIEITTEWGGTWTVRSDDPVKTKLGIE